MGLTSPPSTFSSPRPRSNSLDSLQPSLSDSINTLAHLLPHPPSSPTKPLPPHPHPHSHPHPGVNHRKGKSLPPPLLPANLEARNDLTPEQRALLMRRARKIEQVFGEPLGEMQVKQHVIEPTHAPPTVLTKVTEEWPSSPSSSERGRSGSGEGERIKVPEYDRQDCNPQRTRPGQTADDMGSKASTGAGLAARALARFRFGDGDAASSATGAGAIAGGGSSSSDLRVYVKRELRVAETQTRERQAPETRVPDAELFEPDSPTSPKQATGPEEDRRARRAQLAKVSQHRVAMSNSSYIGSSAFPSRQARSTRLLLQQ